MDKNFTNPVKVLITAGPTIEPLDPVRYLSNYSTGTMGYEIASECAKKGLDVCLISGPVKLSPPPGVEVIRVNTACEMRDKVLEKAEGRDCLIMTAAVCDFRPADKKEHKIKKSEKLTLQLVKNPDILMELKEREDLKKIGFALETEKVLESGRKKLMAKGLDLVIINTKGEAGDPFGPGRKNFRIIDRKNNEKEFIGVTKKQLAGIIIDETEKLLAKRIQ